MTISRRKQDFLVVALLFGSLIAGRYAFAASTLGATTTTPQQTMIATASSSAPTVRSNTTTTSVSENASSTPQSVPLAGQGILLPSTITDLPAIASTTVSTSATSTMISWATPNAVSTSAVVYGVSPQYSAAATGDLSLDHTVVLPNLIPDTLYHFQIASSNGFGTASSSDGTFVTPPGPMNVNGSGAPVISNIFALPTYSIATISWTTDQPAGSEILYGLTVDYSASTTGQSDLSALPTTDHVISISGLSPGTTYHFAVLSAGSSGATTVSPDRTFTTPPTP